MKSIFLTPPNHSHEETPPRSHPLPQNPTSLTQVPRHRHHHPPVLLPRCNPMEVMPSASSSYPAPPIPASAAQPPWEASQGPHGNALWMERWHKGRALYPLGLLAPTWHCPGSLCPSPPKGHQTCCFPSATSVIWGVLM